MNLRILPSEWFSSSYEFKENCEDSDAKKSLIDFDFPLRAADFQFRFAPPTFGSLILDDSWGKCGICGSFYIDQFPQYFHTFHKR